MLLCFSIFVLSAYIEVIFFDASQGEVFFFAEREATTAMWNIAGLKGSKNADYSYKLKVLKILNVNEFVQNMISIAKP